MKRLVLPASIAVLLGVSSPGTAQVLGEDAVGMPMRLLFPPTLQSGVRYEFRSDWERDLVDIGAPGTAAVVLSLISSHGTKVVTVAGATSCDESLFPTEGGTAFSVRSACFSYTPTETRGFSVLLRAQDELTPGRTRVLYRQTGAQSWTTLVGLSTFSAAASPATRGPPASGCSSTRF